MTPITQEITPEDMRAIAEKVYPGKRMAFSMRGGINRLLVSGVGEFNPSLTGTDREAKQALDCIVAAMNLGLDTNLSKQEINGWFFGSFDWQGMPVIKIRNQPDILTASLLAIREATR